MHKTPTKGWEILECILQSNSFLSECSEPPLETASRSDRPWDDESDDESSDEPSPEVTTGNDMQVSTFPFQLEEDLFEDYGNTSNCHF